MVLTCPPLPSIHPSIPLFPAMAWSIWQWWTRGQGPRDWNDDSDYDLKKSWWFWALPQEIMTWSKMNYPHTVLVKLSPGRRPCKLDCCPSETFDEWIKGLLLWTLSARFLIDVQSREKSSFPSSSYHEIIIHCTMGLSIALGIWNIWKCKGLVFAQFWSNTH